MPTLADEATTGVSLGQDPRAGSPEVDRLGLAELHARLGLRPEPARIGRYVVREQLGKGGMGVVLAAHDADLDREVAIKLLDDSRVTAEGSARLIREARSLAKLSHPNIVQVYEAGEVDEVPYLAMELVRGTTLRGWLAGEHEGGEAPNRLAVLDMFLAIGEGLAAAHAAGIVHRDFKPDNVLVGEDGRPRTADFGLAALTREPTPESCETDEPEIADDEQNLTRTGAVMGTPAYMAPEQWLGLPSDARSDQFSYCVALFEGLYGRRPYSGTTLMALREQVLDGEPSSIPGPERVPPALHAALLRGLAQDPDARWPDLDSLLATLREAISMVQPGMFTSSPLPIVRLVAPLMLSLPVVWFVLELVDVVAYSARSWVLVSGVQLTLLAMFIVPLRERVLGEMADRRVIVMPVVFLPLLLGHRALALAAGGSLELVFAYDFLAVAAVGAAVTLLVERGLWPMILFGLGLATVTGARPDWGPHLWLVFTLLAPVVVGTAGARGVERRARGSLGSPTGRLTASQRRSSKSTRETKKG